jgi:hypothetical protein
VQLTLPRQDGAAWGRLWSRAAAPSSCPSTTKPQPGKRSLYPRTRRSKQGTIGSEAAPRYGLLEAGWLTTPLMALKAEAQRASETPRRAEWWRQLSRLDSGRPEPPRQRELVPLSRHSHRGTWSLVPG